MRSRSSIVPKPPFWKRKSKQTSGSQDFLTSARVQEGRHGIGQPATYSMPAFVATRFPCPDIMPNISRQVLA